MAVPNQAAVRLRLEFEDQESFVQGFWPRIDRTIVFLATPSPKEVGTLLWFELTTPGGERLMCAEGRVISVTLGQVEDCTPGMKVRMTKIDKDGQLLLIRMLGLRKAAGAGVATRQQPSAPPLSDFDVPSEEPDAESRVDGTKKVLSHPPIMSLALVHSGRLWHSVPPTASVHPVRTGLFIWLALTIASLAHAIVAGCLVIRWQPSRIMPMTGAIIQAGPESSSDAARNRTAFDKYLETHQENLQQESSAPTQNVTKPARKGTRPRPEVRVATKPPAPWPRKSTSESPLEETAAVQQRPQPGSAGELDNEAYAAFKRKNYRQAIALWDQALAANPKLDMAHGNISFAYLLAGDFPACIAAGQRCIMNVNNPKIIGACYFNIGQCEHKQGSDVAAISAYQKSLTYRENAIVRQALEKLQR